MKLRFRMLFNQSHFDEIANDKIDFIKTFEF